MEKKPSPKGSNKVRVFNGCNFHGFIYRGEKLEIDGFSNKKDLFECKCGKIKLMKIEYIPMGKSKTCGECNKRSAEWWNDRWFNDLVLLYPEDLHLNSSKKKEFKCKCGKVKLIKVSHVTTEVQKACGDCNKKPAKWWKDRKFGSLIMVDPEDLHISSRKKKKFKCKCGNVKSM